MNQSLKTEITMLQFIIAGGRTKEANERPFVFVHQHGGDDVTRKLPIYRLSILCLKHEFAGNKGETANSRHTQGCAFLRSIVIKLSKYPGTADNSGAMMYSRTERMSEKYT